MDELRKKKKPLTAPVATAEQISRGAQTGGMDALRLMGQNFAAAPEQLGALGEAAKQKFGRIMDSISPNKNAAPSMSAMEQADQWAEQDALEKEDLARRAAMMQAYRDKKLAEYEDLRRKGQNTPDDDQYYRQYMK